MTEVETASPLPGTGGRVRAGVWVLHMALPVLGLWLLLARPALDITWQHHPSHFWLVLSVAAVNVAVALRMQRAAHAHGDARLLLVAYAFTVAAGFLFLHALATPGVLVTGSNSGFDVATPIGLAVASALFAGSAVEFTPAAARRIVANERLVRTVLIALMLAWAALSLAEVPPLSRPLSGQARGPLRWMAFAAVALYAISAFRYYLLRRRRPAVMLVAIITAPSTMPKGASCTQLTCGTATSTTATAT